jgi:hypothetical protein
MEEKRSIFRIKKLEEKRPGQLERIGCRPFGGEVMKSGAHIVQSIIIIVIVLHLFGCGLTRLDSANFEIGNGTVVTTSITTTPEKAKLSIVRQMGKEITTVFAPYVVYYALPDYSTHLLVSSSGYRKKIVLLSPYKETIHVTLEKVIEEDMVSNVPMAVSPKIRDGEIYNRRVDDKFEVFRGE